MTAATPKVGDRVRCTFGETVVVGDVVDYFGSLGLDFGTGGTWLFPLAEPFVVEVLTPPIPDVRGVVVLDCDGDAWQRLHHGWDSPGPASALTLDELVEAWGPLTVIHVPEVTP